MTYLKRSWSPLRRQMLHAKARDVKALSTKTMFGFTTFAEKRLMGFIL